MLKYKSDLQAQELHVLKIKNACPTIDTSTPFSVSLNQKVTKKQMLLEMEKDIINGNSKIVKKIAEIYKSKPVYGVSDIHHGNADIPSRVLGRVQRERRERKINFENKLLFDRLQKVTASITAEELREEYLRRLDISSKRSRPVAFGTIQQKELENRSKSFQLSNHGKSIESPSDIHSSIKVSTLSRTSVELNPTFDQPVSMSSTGGYSNLSEFRRQVISAKKYHSRQESKIENSKSTLTTTPKSDISKSIIFELSYRPLVYHSSLS